MEVKVRKEGGSGRAFAGKAVLAAGGLAVAMVVLVTCERQDPLAPEGSTITVSANPQAIVHTIGQPDTTKVTATLRGKNGTRLPDQEITFSTTQGTLTPPAQTPLITDNQGQASSILETTQTATVKAESGSISNTTTVSFLTGKPGNMTMDFPNGTTISACDETIDFTVTASDPNGAGIPNIDIKFDVSAPSGFNVLKGAFDPTTPRTDPNGSRDVTFNPDDNFCLQNCRASDPNAPNGGNCLAKIKPNDFSSSFTSIEVTIDEDVP